MCDPLALQSSLMIFAISADSSRRGLQAAGGQAPLKVLAAGPAIPGAGGCENGVKGGSAIRCGTHGFFGIDLH